MAILSVFFPVFDHSETQERWTHTCPSPKQSSAVFFSPLRLLYSLFLLPLLFFFLLSVSSTSSFFRSSFSPSSLFSISSSFFSSPPSYSLFFCLVSLFSSNHHLQFFCLIFLFSLLLGSGHFPPIHTICNGNPILCTASVQTEFYAARLTFAIDQKVREAKKLIAKAHEAHEAHERHVPPILCRLGLISGRWGWVERTRR